MYWSKQWESFSWIRAKLIEMKIGLMSSKSELPLLTYALSLLIPLVTLWPEFRQMLTFGVINELDQELIDYLRVNIVDDSICFFFLNWDDSEECWANCMPQVVFNLIARYFCWERNGKRSSGVPFHDLIWYLIVTVFKLYLTWNWRFDLEVFLFYFVGLRVLLHSLFSQYSQSVDLFLWVRTPFL